MTDFAASETLASPAHGGTAIQDVSPSDDPDAAPSDDPVWAYFLGKASFIFYHDLAAALLERFDLSYSGKKTAAVDQLTALLLVTEGPRQYGGIAVLDAVLGWLDSWHQAARDDVQASGASVDEVTGTDLPPSWAAQNVSAARLTQIACLVYGSDPRARRVLHDDGILSADEARDCPGDYVRIKERWQHALQDAKIAWQPGGGVAASSDAGEGAERTPSFALEYRPAGNAMSGDIVGWLHDVGLFDAQIADLNQDFGLPAPVKVVLDQCGTATTSFDPDSGRLRLCYELLQNVYDAATAQNVEAPPE